MAKHLVLKDATSRIEYVFIQNSSLTTGAGLTGLVYNSASLTAYYVRAGAAAAAITLATQTAAGAFSSGGFVEVDATNMPGVYRFDPPNAAFATGVDKVTFMLKGATNMAPVLLEYQLAGFDAGAALATPTNISAATGIVLSGVTHTGAVIPTVTALTGHTAQTGDSFARIGANGSGLTSLATPTNITAGTITTVTTVTNDVGITQTAADKVFGASGAAMSELSQGIPSATPSPRAAIMLLYMALRNVLSVTATTKSITNDAGIVITKKALSDDGTTYSEAEMVAGP